MKHFGGCGVVLLLSAGLFGQPRGIAQPHGIVQSPVVSSGFGQVFSPARRSISTLPRGGHARPTTGGAIYGYPVYVGGYGYLGNDYLDSYGQPYYGPDTDGYAQNYPAPPPQPVPQSSTTVILPPQQTTVIINPSPDGSTPKVTVLQGPPPGYGPPPQPPQSAPAAGPSSGSNDAPHYLIALKDHTVYAAIAYWLDGDTLHYFTNPDTHNQVSLALVDRDLTARLNKEAGIDLTLPAPSAAK